MVACRQHKLLKRKILPVIGSSTVQCYGFYNYKSGVVEMIGRRDIM